MYVVPGANSLGGIADHHGLHWPPVDRAAENAGEREKKKKKVNAEEVAPTLITNQGKQKSKQINQVHGPG